MMMDSEKLDNPKELVYYSSDVFAEDFLIEFVVEFNELRKQFVELHNKFIDLENENKELRKLINPLVGW